MILHQHVVRSIGASWVMWAYYRITWCQDIFTYWQSELDLPNNSVELLEVGLSIEADKSVTPAIVGVAQCSQGQVSSYKSK